MKYHFQLNKKDDGGFYAHCLEIFSCAASAPSREETILRAQAALKDTLDTPPTHCLLPSALRGEFQAIHSRYNLPKSAEIFSIPVAPATALALSLRRLRAREGLYQTDIAKRLGIKNISAYQRLEDPLHSNPTLETLARLKKVFPALDIANLFEPDL